MSPRPANCELPPRWEAPTGFWLAKTYMSVLFFFFGDGWRVRLVDTIPVDEVTSCVGVAIKIGELENM